MIIQIILVLSILLISVWWARNRRKPRISAIGKIGLLIGLISAFLIIFNPEYSTEIANKIGVGRGTDLLTYINTVLLFYLVLTTSLGLRDLRSENSRIISQLAIEKGLIENNIENDE